MQRPFRITHVNKAWTELCGFELEECQGKSLSILQVALVWWWNVYEKCFRLRFPCTSTQNGCQSRCGGVLEKSRTRVYLN